MSHNQQQHRRLSSTSKKLFIRLALREWSRVGEVGCMGGGRMLVLLLVRVSEVWVWV
jgi:hypothetical protein